MFKILLEKQNNFNTFVKIFFFPIFSTKYHIKIKIIAHLTLRIAFFSNRRSAFTNKTQHLTQKDKRKTVVSPKTLLKVPYHAVGRL